MNFDNWFFKKMKNHFLTTIFRLIKLKIILEVFKLKPIRIYWITQKHYFDDKKVKGKHT